ncbi:MAG: 50S ribosomal protein L32 [Chloroflexi bacterium]|nr:50S ribosomal protein L32 [Chloroflexota bacterium]
MTGVPKKRVSHSHQGNRRSHDRLTLPALMTCPQCRQKKLQHHVCLNCGYYHGRKVIEPVAARRSARQ